MICTSTLSGIINNDNSDFKAMSQILEPIMLSETLSLFPLGAVRTLIINSGLPVPNAMINNPATSLVTPEDEAVEEPPLKTGIPPI